MNSPGAGMLPQEEVDEQLQLLQAHRRTLATYLRQQAAFGEAYSPPALLSGIAEARSHIQRIKAALHAAGVEVPEDIDDDAPPHPAMPGRPNRARVGLAAVIAAGILLLAIGVALGNVGGSWLGRQETAGPVGSVGATPEPTVPVEASTPDRIAPTEPASETNATAAPEAGTAEPTDTTPFAEYTFADGAAHGWSGLPEHWQVVQDDSGYVYQAQASATNYTDSTPPDVDTLASLQNYAVEMRVKIVQPDTPDDDLSTMWLSLRAQFASSDGCDAYNFRFSQAHSSATISLAGDTAGCDQDLAQGSVDLDTDVWHTIRAEVNDAQLSLFVDDELVASATDTALTKGFFYITVGPGATIQFADVRVDEL